MRRIIIKSVVGSASYRSLAIKVRCLLFANTSELALRSSLLPLARAVDGPTLVLDTLASFLARVPPLFATARAL